MKLLDRGFPRPICTQRYSERRPDCQRQGTYSLGRFLAHSSILCAVMGADQNKESFPYPGVGSTVKNIQDCSRRMRTPVGADHNMESQGRNREIRRGRGLNSV